MDNKNQKYAELLEKAKGCASAAEIADMARQSGVELDEEEAEEYFTRLHAAGELADEELDAVSGGGCTDAEYDGPAEVYCPNCGALMKEYYKVMKRRGGDWFHLCPQCRYDTRISQCRNPK